jgi:hypothetical protein
MSRSQRTKTDRTGQLEIFPTPSWAVTALLDCLRPRSGTFFEPCAGEGHIVRAVDAWFATNRPDEPPPTWEYTDIRPTRYAQPACDMARGDNLFSRRGRRFDTILTNPPFSRAFDLFHVLLPLAARSLAFLLPLSWLGSSERANALRTWQPHLFVLPERPIFRGEGTDQEVYAWFVWARKSVTINVVEGINAPVLGYSLLRILPATPIGVRRASEKAAFAEMPAEWHAEVAARREARKQRERERRDVSVVVR